MGGQRPRWQGWRVLGSRARGEAEADGESALARTMVGSVEVSLEECSEMVPPKENDETQKISDCGTS